MPHQQDVHDYADRRPVAATTPRGVQQGSAVLSAGLALQPDLATQAHRLHMQRRTRSLLVSADYRMRERVGHPDGGQCPVEQILQAEEEQRDQIEFETKSGSRKHHRLPAPVRQVARLVLLLDVCPLIYFFAGMTEVNWRTPWSANLAFAIALAAMVTSLCYGSLVFTGHRLRALKNHAGTVYRDEVDGVTRIALGIAVVLVLIFAVVMFTWTRIEVRYAFGHVGGYATAVIATALTVINAAASCLVIAVQALDGSDQVARLNKLSAAVRRSTVRANRMRELAARASRPHCKPAD